MFIRLTFLVWLTSGLMAQSPASSITRVDLTSSTFTNSLGMTFVKIASSQFQMGSPEGQGEAVEYPKHAVSISKPFFLGTCEVTQAQWKAVLTENPSKFKGDDRPVEFVSWQDAKVFIARLNELEKGMNEYRLPTESEWEYACRAKNDGDFCFGDGETTLKDYGWFDANAGGSTQSVAKKKPNAWDIYDLHGNVWEWCEDVWHDNYNGAPTDGSAWLSGGQTQKRVVRGGSWAFDSAEARSGFRMGIDASSRLGDSLGFRVVVIPKD